MGNGGQEILTQLTNFNNYVPESKPNNVHHLIFSKECPACRGDGIWRKKIVKTYRKEVKCNRCVDGYIAVPCNNCFEGWTETGPCRTCKGTGVFVYHPTTRFPEGKKCRFCQGTGTRIITKVDVIPQVTCLKCKGTGEIRTSFNPVIKEDDLALFEMVDEVITKLFKPLQVTID